MAIKNSFSGLAGANNTMSRRFGSTIGGAEPYVTGTFGVWFDKLPAMLPAYVANESSGALNDAQIKSILAASCTGVTPPGGTLNKVEFTGTGGTKWSVPGNIDYGNSVSFKFFEMNNLPIMSIMHAWVKLIRDYRYGVSGIVDGEEANYSKATYAGLAYYWTTSPDGATVQYYAAYDGLFPGKDPQDMMASDVETVGKVDIEIEMNVDYAWHEPWVKTKCQTFATTYSAASKEAIDKYSGQ